jgi:hypothetical protein
VSRQRTPYEVARRLGSPPASAPAGHPSPTFSVGNREFSRLSGASTAALTTRRDLGRRLELHPDSVSRLLWHGLGCAVRAWDGRGRALAFDLAAALRWWFAWTCPDKGGPLGACDDCAEVLFAARFVSDHLAKVRRFDPKDDPPPQRLGQPCRRVPYPRAAGKHSRSAR